MTLPAVGVLTLGCPKNVADSEEMLGRLGEEGFPLALAAELADVLVVNTCAFVSDAVAESVDAIERCLAYRDRGDGPARVVAVGCLPLRPGRWEVLDRVDAAFGVGELDALAAYLRGEAPPPSAPSLRPCGGGARFRLGPAHTAYLKVSEGCDNRCAYCTIPSIRGRQRSRSLEDLAAEAAALADAGARELVLVAQDVAAWGSDRPGTGDLADLFAALERVEGLRWIRALYLHPAHLTGRMLEAAAASDKVVPYFDVPVQHCDDRLLASMRRRTTGEGLRALIARIRSLLPGAALRTTVIAGLPGETEEAFEALLAFLEQSRFDRLGAFPYSPEPGTAAASLPGRVDPAVVDERCRRVRELAARLAAEANRSLRGRTFLAVADEEAGPGLWACRSYREAFDIDPVILVAGQDTEPGRWGRVEITGAEGPDLLGRWTEEAP